MRYRGRISFNKELTYSQAEHIKLFCTAKQTKRPYDRAHFKVTSDGIGLIWDGDEKAKNLEIALADIINLYISKWGIIAVGILNVTGNKRMYDIVVLKNKVKIWEHNTITSVSPSAI